MDSAKTARMPLWLKVVGVVANIGAALLAGRLVWEETVWTWARGPQMVGFSLAHGNYFFLLLSAPVLTIWFVIVTALTVMSLIKGKLVSVRRLVALGLTVVIFVVSGLPDRFWHRLFISKTVHSAKAPKLINHAAYLNDLGLVRAMVSHGVHVNVKDPSDWRTPLHAAAVTGHIPIIIYLLSQGADIDALDREGDSPLQLAISNGNTKAAAYLEKQGAKNIHGTEAQREKAIEDIVKEGILDSYKNNSAHGHL